MSECELGLRQSERLNLTQAQQGIWVGQQLQPHSPMYNAAEYLDIKGPVDKSIFSQALNKSIRNTVALKMQFRHDSRGTFQCFFPRATNYRYMDLRDDAYAFNTATNYMKSDLGEVCDLSKDPLYHFALIQLTENHYFFYLRIHHIAADGFAFALFTQELFKAYQQLKQKIYAVEDVSSSEMDKTDEWLTYFSAYKKALDEERSYQSSHYCEKDRDYWLGKLSGMGEPSSFSNSSAPMSAKKIHLVSVITTAQHTSLKSLAQAHAFNWSDLILAMVACVLYQYRGHTDVCLGLPLMGRMGSQSLRVPMMWMNIAALALKIKSGDSFFDVVYRLTNTLKKDRAHHRYRYEALASELKQCYGRQRLYAPVVNIMPFDRHYQLTDCALEFHSLSAGPIEDIAFNFSVKEDGTIKFSIDANAERYKKNDVETIKRQCDDFIDNLSLRWSKPLQLNKRDFSWLEGEFFDSFPRENEILVWPKIVDVARKQPLQLALKQNAIEVNYSQLLQQVNQLSSVLINLVETTGKIVAIYLPRSIQSIVSALACTQCGCGFLFLDMQVSAQRNRTIIHDADCCLVIEMAPESFPDDDLLKLDITDFEYLLDVGNASDPVTLNYAKANAEDPAYIIYTSGSSGKPKGILVSQKALAEFVDSAIDAYKITPNDRVLQFAPLHFDACIEEIFCSLCAGASLVIRNDDMLHSSQAFYRQCDIWKISVLDLPTAYWHELCHTTVVQKLVLPPTLRAVIIGGEAVLEQRVKSWRQLVGRHILLFNSYGPSEATVVATVAEISQINAAITIGQPLSNRAVVVVDPHDQALKKGEVGELLLLGGGLADGYLGDPHQSEKSFFDVDMPWLHKPVKAYRTGDLVMINAQEEIEYRGRLDAQMKISGQRIEPLEIESQLLALTGILHAAVTLEKNQFVSRLCAHVVLNEEGVIWEDITVLRQALAQVLAPAMLPNTVCRHSCLPKSSSGKVDRSLLVQTLPSVVYEDASMTPLQLQIAKAWNEVLGQEKIKLEDDFFLLGGQSLQCIQLANRLSEQLQRNISANLIFDYPILADFVAALSQQQQSFKQRQQFTFMRIQDDINDFNQQLHQLSLLSEKQTNDFNENDEAVKNSVLLTGATGFVGTFLLQQLLEKTQKPIICFIRSDSVESAVVRIRDSFRLHQLDHLLSPAYSARIEVVIADLQLPNFGLTDKYCHELFSRVDLIIHNAALTSVMRDYHSLRNINSLATAALIKQALTHTCTMQLISTIAVADKAENYLPEDFIAMHQSLQDGYQQTKWLSERMMQLAIAHGLQGYVYRLGRMTGPASTAFVNPQDLIWRLLQAGLFHACLPRLNISEPWTRVDEIADFIIAHSIDGLRLETANTSFVSNLMPDQNISVEKLYGWLKEAGYQFELLDMGSWCQRIEDVGREEDQSILAFFKAQMDVVNERREGVVDEPETSHENAAMSIERHRFKQELSQLNHQLTPLGKKQFGDYLSYAVANYRLAINDVESTLTQEQDEEEWICQ